jgi:hypothetical protein
VFGEDTDIEPFLPSRRSIATTNYDEIQFLEEANITSNYSGHP